MELEKIREEILQELENCLQAWHQWSDNSFTAGRIQGVKTAENIINRVFDKQVKDDA